MDKIKQDYEEFYSDATVRADSDGNWMIAAMFELFGDVAMENGDVEELDYTPYKSQRSRIDGYQFDSETGTVTIAIADFRDSDSLEKLNSSDISTAFKRAENFVSNSFTNKFVSSLEESGSGFQVAYLLMSEKQNISRIRFLLLSNALLVSRMTGLQNKDKDGIVYSYSVLDFGRYSDIINSRTGNEPVVVDIVELGHPPLPYLLAASDQNEYESYLLAISGDLLAKIYSEFGPRLLEQNVRTFLQARGKVNKGIQQTLKNDPEMFFAYNNGLTATAANIEICPLPNGGQGISRINNLQIVNGGQTTASMLYAQDKNKTDLSKVYIQAKLSVINEDRIGDVVPKISRFANTQNRVSEADFFSNHPFHVRIEKFSRRISAAPQEGQFAQSKWFYERARGQYKDCQAYLTEAKKRAFLVEYPRQQMITKTDLAKYENSFAREPHIVSSGAQKNFIDFAKKISTRWKQSDIYFNEQWYRDAVGKAIIFKELDRMVRAAEWYENSYKANIVTYSIAWLVQHLETRNHAELDFSRVWQNQSISSDLRSVLATVSRKVSEKIQDTQNDVRNVTEWCKKKSCWEILKNFPIDVDGQLLEKFSKNKGEIDEIKRDAKKTQTIDNNISDEIFVYQLGEKWREIREYAMANELLTSKQDQFISRILSGKPPTTTQTKHLMEVLEKVKSSGMEI